MNDEQPPTAPGFRSLPIAPETGPTASVPLRGAWSLRRKAAMAVAALALVGTGGAVAGSLTGDQHGTDSPAQTGTSGHHRPAQPSGEGEHEADEA